MKKILNFSDPIRLVEGKHGYMLYNKYCHYVGRALELYGEYCEHEIELMRQLIQPNDSIWEIGANTGSMSVALSKLVKGGSGEYVGFEPQIELYKIFVSNLTLNNCENARSFNFGLGKNNHMLKLPAVNYHLPNNFGAVSLNSKSPEGKSAVEVRTIDDLLWLRPPSFMKIDVEGMEMDVLVGGQETIKQHWPIIYVENDRPDKSQELIDWIWNAKYDCYWHITPYFNKSNFFNNPNNIYSNTCSFNMLCIPQSKEIKMAGLPKINDSSYHPLRRTV